MVHCPKCETRIVRLAPQRSLGERLLGFLTIYPNRCQICAHRFMAFKGHRGFVPQRSYKRVPVQYPTTFRSASYEDPSTALEGTVVDLSIAGCRINSQIRMPQGARLRVQFEVSEHQPPISIEEAVVSSHPGKGTGLSFTKIAGHEKIRLGRILRHRLAGMSPRGRRAPHARTSAA